MAKRITLILLALLAAGCFKFDPRSKDKTPRDKEVAPDANGVVSSKYHAQSANAYEMQAKDAGAITGASIMIPPGALAVDTNVTMEEGAAIVSDAYARSIGLDGA